MWAPALQGKLPRPLEAVMLSLKLYTMLVFHTTCSTTETMRLARRSVPTTKARIAVPGMVAHLVAAARAFQLRVRANQGSYRRRLHAYRSSMRLQQERRPSCWRSVDASTLRT